MDRQSTHLLLHRLAKNLANAFVIEEHRHAATCDENCYTIAQYECFRVVNLEAMSADQLYGKHLERCPSLKRT